MAVRFCLADGGCCHLAQFEKYRACGTVAKLSFVRGFVGRAHCAFVGLLALPSFFQPVPCIFAIALAVGGAEAWMAFLRRDRSHLVRTIFANRLSKKNFIGLATARSMARRKRTKRVWLSAILPTDMDLRMTLILSVSLKRWQNLSARPLTV